MAARPRLLRTAGVPMRKKNGITGMIAPIANKKKEAIAASHAEPPSSLGSIPSSWPARRALVT